MWLHALEREGTLARPTFELVVVWESIPAPGTLKAFFAELVETFSLEQVTSVCTFHATRVPAALLLTIDFSAYSRRSLDRLARSASVSGARVIEPARLPDKDRDDFRAAFSKGERSMAVDIEEAGQLIARRLYVA